MVLSPGAIVFYAYIPCIIFDIVIFSAILYKLYIVHNKRSRKISQFQQILHIICFTAIILTSLFDAAHGFVAMITNTNLFGKASLKSLVIIELFADIFYYTNSLLLYIILIHRLFSTFTNTSFAISVYFFYFISFQIMLQIILMTLYCMNLAIFNCITTAWCNRLGVTASLITFNDYILNILLFSLFVNKLRQLIVTKLTAAVGEYNNMHMKINKALNNNKADNKLLNVITKQTVIGTFITLTNQAFATCIFITFTFDSAEKAESSVMIAYLLRGFEGAFVCFLLYLGLIINNKEYMKICKLCHKGCYNLCISMTQRKVNNLSQHYDYIAL
eukprot:541389_1